MSDVPFETLIGSKHYKTAERWYPISAERYRTAFKIDYSVKNSQALEKNLSYSMQYLEFLEKEMAELNVSAVIYTMLVKTYVITACKNRETISFQKQYNQFLKQTKY